MVKINKLTKQIKLVLCAFITCYEYSYIAVLQQLHDSIVVSIPACHAGDRGSIPRRGVFF